VYLCQDSYIEKVANKYHLTNHKAPATPLPPDDLETYGLKATPQEIHAYQGKVGSLQFAASVTRPDTAHTASKLAEYLTNPGPQHMAAVDQALAYLYATRFMAIVFGPLESDTAGQEVFDTLLHRVFDPYSDAAFANCTRTRRSAQGYLFKLFGGPIDWQSSKQKTVSTSTTEAELLALSNASKEAIWWHRLFKDLGFDPGHELEIKCDNKQTIRLLVKDVPILMTKLKHIDILHHWLREQVQTKQIKVSWVSTNRMIADGLTKALPRQKHEEFVKQLGLVDTSSLVG
jgi:hypothetical protein